MPKRISIKAAKQLAKDLGLNQVILLAWDGELTHIVTYGESAEDCDQAAQRAMGPSSSGKSEDYHAFTQS